MNDPIKLQNQVWKLEKELEKVKQENEHLKCKMQTKSRIEAGRLDVMKQLLKRKTEANKRMNQSIVALLDRPL